MEKNIALTDKEVRFIEKMGLYYEDYGIPRIGGKILALLMAVEEPISAEQISALLEVSRGSISTNVRLLSSAGFLEKTTQKGERTDYFKISEAAWENIIKLRIEGFQKLQELVEEGPQNQKMQEMLAWTMAMTESHQALLERWRKRK